MSHFDNNQTNPGDFSLPVQIFYQPANKGGIECSSVFLICSGAVGEIPPAVHTSTGIIRIRQKSHFLVGKQWRICAAHVLILCFSAGQKENLLIE